MFVALASIMDDRRMEEESGRGEGEVEREVM